MTQMEAVAKLWLSVFQDIPSEIQKESGASSCDCVRSLRLVVQMELYETITASLQQGCVYSLRPRGETMACTYVPPTGVLCCRCLPSIQLPWKSRRHSRKGPAVEGAGKEREAASLHAMQTEQTGLSAGARRFCSLVRQHGTHTHPPTHTQKKHTACSAKRKQGYPRINAGAGGLRGCRPVCCSTCRMNKRVSIR